MTVNYSNISRIHILFILAISFLSFSCATNQKIAPTESAIWKYETKAQVTDKVKKESQTVSIDLYTHMQNNYRLEVTASMGYQVASVTMKKNAGSDALVYILFPQKAYGVGPLSAKSMRPLFNQNLDPNLLIDLIEDRQLRKYDLLCGRQTDTSVKCTNDELQIVVEKPATKDDGFIRRITIDAPSYRLVWIFKSQDYMNDFDNETLAKTFVLDPPDAFRRLEIK